MKTLKLEALVPGMKVARDVYERSGLLVVSAGTTLTMDLISKLANWNLIELQVDEPAATLKDEQEKVLSAQIAVAHDRVIGITENIMAADESNIDPDVLRGMVGDLDSQIELSSNVLLNLSHMKNYDNYLYAHVVNVCVLSLIIAKELRLKDEQIRELGQAALLHDYGMVRLERSIYDHERALTDEEWEKIKTHSFEGYQMLKNAGNFSDDILSGVLDHHERLDGSGYPSRKKGDQIHIFGKIIAAADVYDACISMRKHRQRMTPREALKYMMDNLGLFDVNILRAFISSMAIYPIGSFVKLNTGEIAKVIGIHHGKPFRPEIRIMLDRNRQKLEIPIRIDLDLEEFMRTYIEETLERSVLEELYPLLQE